MSQLFWEQSVRESRRLLQSGVEQNWDETYCKQLVTALLPESAHEFRGLLWDQARKGCNFARNGDRNVLASYGWGLERVFEAILQESSVPMHFSALAEQAAQRLGKDIDLARARNEAAEVGILLSRGVYGLERHIGLTEIELSALQEEVEDIVWSGPSDRQWHASEILTVLAERETIVSTREGILTHLRALVTGPERDAVALAFKSD
jgi:hypothetical protein